MSDLEFWLDRIGVVFLIVLITFIFSKCEYNELKKVRDNVCKGEKSSFVFKGTEYNCIVGVKLK